MNNRDRQYRDSALIGCIATGGILLLVLITVAWNAILFFKNL